MRLEGARDVWIHPRNRPSRGGCPPHGPHLIEAIREGRYAVRCLGCGLVGPVREDQLTARLAFDEIVP